MALRRSVRLLASPTLEAWDVRCTAASGPAGLEEHASLTQVILPLQGVFEVHRGPESATADAASAVVFEAGSDHRVGHPTDRGDRCLVLIYPQETITDALEPGSGFGGSVGSATALAARVLVAGLHLDVLSAMEAEEHGLGLLARISMELGRTRGYRPPNRHQLARIERTRAMLAAEPAKRWRLDELGRALYCSPFHLARQFRSVTGVSISGYLLRLRLALATERLAEGADDLAALAADLGFANHSHFSARFRSVFGLPPGVVRQALTAGELAELRTFVTADGNVAV